MRNSRVWGGFKGFLIFGCRVLGSRVSSFGLISKLWNTQV